MSGAEAVVVHGSDPGPMARLEVVKAAAGTASVVFQRLTEGETLKSIAEDWQIPRGRFAQWFMDEHSDLFDDAEKVRAQDLKAEALERADSATVDDVAPRKLQVDTRMRLLPLMDRARYGASKDAGAGGVTVIVDRSCGGSVEVSAPGGSKVVVSQSSTEASAEPAVIEEI